MLSKFSVQGFKSFNEKIEFDLEKTRNYDFNKECVKNNLVNLGIIYGINGCGKSNLGLAIFDIVNHLTTFGTDYYNSYLNAEKPSKQAEFEYNFKFGSDVVVYKYAKKDIHTIIYEDFSINSNSLLSYNRNDNNIAKFSIPGSETLNPDLKNSPISIINYIKNNALLKDSKEKDIFDKFTNFVNKMLYFKSLNVNSYIGLQSGRDYIYEDIIKQDHVQEFEKFLNEAGIKCKLKIITSGEKREIAFDFNGNLIPFLENASTGTNSLSLFYYWMQRFLYNEQCSFIFIDEFDAFYHYKLSKLIVEKMKRVKNAQIILTTHNTAIMSNELLRPDCYFILKEKKINPIFDLTEKELREGHNIEKMYKAGSF